MMNKVSSDIYIPSNVNINTKFISIYNLMKRVENHLIVFSGDCPSCDKLLTNEQQSQIIESLMLKIPIPSLYFRAIENEIWVSLSGIQYIVAFQKFLLGPSKEKFTGLQYYTDFNGLIFDELPKQFIRRVKESTITVHVVESGTPEEIVHNIYQRINVGR